MKGSNWLGEHLILDIIALYRHDWSLDVEFAISLTYLSEICEEALCKTVCCLGSKPPT